MTPKFSVIVPTYNRASRLRRALLSYLATPGDNIEFLIVDDASPDKTKEVILEFEAKDSRVRSIIRSSNLGPKLNMSMAVQEVKAANFMLLSDDDTITEGLIPQVMKIFDHFPSVGVVHVRQEGYHKQAKITPAAAENKYYNNGQEALVETFMLSGALPGMSFRKSLFDQNIWNLGDIYGQVWMNGQVVLKHDAYYLSPANDFVLIGQDDSIFIKSQSRPNDYGIGERARAAKFISGLLSTSATSDVLAQLLRKLGSWGTTIYEDLYNSGNYTSAMNFMHALYRDEIVGGSFAFWKSFYDKLNRQHISHTPGLRSKVIGSALFSLIRSKHII
jgi:glycosyltransferase involved in cell wall biosynthesis